MFENALAQLAIVATFVQRFISLVKPLYQNTSYQRYFDMALSVVVSAVLCASWQVDVFALAGIDLAVWGDLLTGVVAALGSNVLNDVLILLETWKNQKKAELLLTASIVTDAVEELEDVRG